jgi:hypothetical protein
MLASQKGGICTSCRVVPLHSAGGIEDALSMHEATSLGRMGGRFCISAARARPPRSRITSTA